MEMVKIQILGERGAKTLREMSGRGRASCISGNIYLVPAPTLDLLAKLGATFRKFNADGYPEKSTTDEMLDGLEKQCGKLVVQKVGQSEEVAHQHLNHPKPKYRFAALYLIESKWGLTQDVADLCEELAVSDPDAHVRSLVADALGTYYMSSGNMRIGDLLARTVYNENEDFRVRQSAYWSLYSLQEEYVWDRPDILNFRFPENVDWAFVNSWLRQSLIKRFLRRGCHTIARLLRWNKPSARTKS
jgi:hypothetical protein